MELQGSITINGKRYAKGGFIPWYRVYPFFLVHMGVFGFSGFLMAYSGDGPGLVLLYTHGGFACVIYLVFYVTIFGVDQIRWMFINAALGLFGIYAQIDWILSRFGDPDLVPRQPPGWPWMRCPIRLIRWRFAEIPCESWVDTMAGHAGRPVLMFRRLCVRGVWRG